MSGSAGVEHEKRSKTVDMAKKGTKSEKHSGRLKGWKRRWSAVRAQVSKKKAA